MLVKNSLAVAWILQNPMAGMKIKKPLEAALSGYPWGVGRGGLGGGAFKCLQTHFYTAWIFNKQILFLLGFFFFQASVLSLFFTL